MSELHGEVKYDRIRVERLSFAYDTHLVLDAINFTVHEGEVLAVLGPNGVGKSTLFHCLLGFNNKRFKGEISICGESVRKTSPATLAKRVAFVPQSHSPTFNYTVRDMVLMGTTAQIGGLGAPRAAELKLAEDAMTRAGVLHLAERGYTHISGGERQLTLVARAMAQQAKILIMDEPTANLDFGNQIRVMRRIRELTREGYAVVLSTHNPEHALRFADRVLAINRGTIVAIGAPSEVITDALICELYSLSATEIAEYRQ
ncbi:MAG: ABC transporter ATP-binding protein [Oscillospiraceae bacterium]|jgi:iron complex transport system ATP-binding protein|nr:ABC transporter ATP-binding protein [Oscillospiraceae bacterium]